MIITLFDKTTEAYTRHNQIIDSDWTGVVDLLLQHNDYKIKEQVPLFNLWQFKTTDYELGRKYKYIDGKKTKDFTEIPDTIRRCKNNSLAVWGIVLDYDGTETIQDVVSDLSHFEFVLYTTFRHTDNTHKFRIVLPFTRAVTRDELKSKKQSIVDTFKDCDGASFSESQAFHLHSGCRHLSYHNKGIILDPDWFEIEVFAPPVIAVPRTEAASFSPDSGGYKEKLIESLATCSGLHYAGRTDGLGVLTLVALCKTAELTYQEFDTLCWNMASSDSSLQDQRKREMVWNDWNPYHGITKEVREKFIKTYGGVSKFAQVGDSFMEHKRKLEEEQKVMLQVMAKFKRK